MGALGDTYAEVLHALYALEAHRGIDLKLERTRAILAALGDPQKQLATIHIAGTNGKGSVAAMLHSMALGAGLKTALYTSPHLVNFTERIRVGWSEIDEGQVVDLANEVAGVAARLGIDLTFFEVVTVMALLHFARQRVDLAVIETGLGGRFDATNVLDPLVAVITSIGFDHEEFLGNDLASIAFEKCGIIKDGRPVVAGPMPPAAMRVVRETAQQRLAPLTVVDDGLCDLPIGLRGRHQQANAKIAIAAAALLPGRWQITTSQIHAGLSRVYWPGRLAVIERQPLLILDGAHNPAGVAQLCSELPAIAAGRRLHLLFSVMRDKNWAAMVQGLAAVVSSVTITSASPTRAADPALLAREFASYGLPADIEADPAVAFRSLVNAIDRQDALLVAGSLFLIGAIYRELLHDAGRQRLFDAAPALHP